MVHFYIWLGWNLFWAELGGKLDWAGPGVFGWVGDSVLLEIGVGFLFGLDWDVLEICLVLAGLGRAFG